MSATQGALEFTLGLQVNKFLEGLGLSAGHLLSFAGVVEGVNRVLENMWRQVEKGAALNDLSKRTGESVSTLYQLQKGFAAAGANAEDVGGMLFVMQKALGGVNELGQSTEDVFSRLGLSLADLKKQNAAAQFTSILQALSGLSQEDAAKAASSIFVRGGAAQVVQMSRSLEEVREAMARGAADGRNYERVAEAFDTLEKTVGRIKGKLEPLWLSLAERALPAMQAISNIIDQLDLKKGIWNIFADGKLSTLISLSLQAGFETAVEWFGKALTAVIAGAQAALTTIFSRDYGTMLKEGIGGRQQLGVASWQTEQARALREQALKLPADDPRRQDLARRAMALSNEAAGARDSGMAAVNRAAGAADNVSKAFADGLAKALKEGGAYGMGTSARDALTAFFKANGGTGAETPQPTAKIPSTGIFEDLGKEAKPTAGTMLEKLGFVMGGGYDNPLPYHRKTADNTSRLCEQMDRLIGVAAPKEFVHAPG